MKQKTVGRPKIFDDKSVVIAMRVPEKKKKEIKMAFTKIVKKYRTELSDFSE